MKKVVLYTDGMNLYAKDDNTSIVIGPLQPEVEELQEDRTLEASTIVELTKAGLSIDDMSKLRREGLL